MILISERLPFSKWINRKFLHAMIGNLPFIMPFFTASIYPFLVAFPFILVTFLATPYSPVKLPGRLGALTEEGHSMGLVMYALSYSTLAWFFGSKPYIVAAGILPMAYGDSTAAILGTKFGAHRYKITESKSIEGSAGMFLGSFLSILVALLYFSHFYVFSFPNPIYPAIVIAVLTTIIEAAMPRGLDNIAVPLIGAGTFILLNSWF